MSDESLTDSTQIDVDDDIKPQGSNIENFIEKMGMQRIALMAGIMIALLFFFIFIITKISSPNMDLLYSQLDPTEAAQVATKLSELGVKYQLSEGNTMIEVPQNDVDRARIELAKDGIPSGASIGYELFDNKTGFGTTNLVQNLNQKRALEGELSRTINSLDPVKQSRVHIVLPERELFSRESRQPSASVTLNMRQGERLTADQILGIQSLIASAVPELRSKNVSVIDSTGEILANGDESDGLVNVKADEKKARMEGRLQQRIEGLVGRIVGFDNISASVAAELDFNQITQSEEIFDPEGQVIRSAQNIEENNLQRAPPEQNVGIENNLPGFDGDLLNGNSPTEESNRIEETTNFEISRITRNTIQESGTIKRLSVSVLVDGFYTLNEEGQRVYNERSEDELDEIATLVRSAIGLDESRGDVLEVVNRQFQVEEEPEPVDDTILGFEKDELLDAASILMVTILIILVLLLVIQPMVTRLLDINKEIASDEAEAEANAMLPNMNLETALLEDGGDGSLMGDEADDDELIDMKKVQGKVKASSVKKVEDIVENYPAETVNVLRAWMTSDASS